MGHLNDSRATARLPSAAGRAGYLSGAPSLVVLSILAEAENYGHAILARIDSLTDGRLRWSNSELYRVLHRLEKRGLVRGLWRASSPGRSRKYYALTRVGRGEVERWRTVWIALGRLSGAEAGRDALTCRATGDALRPGEKRTAASFRP